MKYDTSSYTEKIDLYNYPETTYVQRNELDRFGFSWLLAYHIGHNTDLPNKARCSWLHGWKWFPPDDYRYYWWDGCKSLHLKTHVVNHIYEAALLKEVHGFRTVLIGGLPFAYALHNLERFEPIFNFSCQLSRERDTCVYLPKCEYDTLAAKALIEEICDNNHLSHRSIFIVFGDDTKNCSLLSMIAKTNIPYLHGSCPRNRYDLIRTMFLLRKFRYLVTNSIGSHIPYGAALGLKILITSNLRERNATEFLSYASMKKYPKWFFERLSWYHSKEYFFDKFRYQFSPNTFTSDLTQWGKFEVGYDRILQKEALKFALGWNLSGRLNSIFEATKFNLNELLLTRQDATERV